MGIRKLRRFAGAHRLPIFLTSLVLGSALVLAQSADNAAPTLTNATFSPTTINTAGASEIVTVTVAFTDDLSGVQSALACFRSPSGTATLCGSANTIATGTPTNGTMNLPVTFPQFSEQGTWHLNQITLTDGTAKQTVIFGEVNLQPFGSTLLINEQPSPLLTVIRAGSGGGSVTSNPDGINCGTDCSEFYAGGTSVTLTATAAPGSVFIGWSGGGCFGTGPCTVTMTADTTVTATFNLQPVTLTIAKTGTGSGTVTSQDGSINCGADCSEAYAPGTSVILTATPTSGSSFAGWSGGGCFGTGPCSLSVTGNTTVTATFQTGITLTIVKLGTGTGTVKSSDGRINCGTDCSENYPGPSGLGLRAEADVGSIFTGWSGTLCSGTGFCNISSSSFTSSSTVTATFDVDPTFKPMSFTAPNHFGVSSQPEAAVAGDFNADGNQDLAVYNVASGNVSLLVGNGNGTFLEASNFAVAVPDIVFGYPQRIGSGDFNGDGRPDLAFAVDSRVAILLHTGTNPPTFTAPTFFTLGTGQATAVGVGDLDGDARLDLAITHHSANVVSLLFGAGNGAFADPQTLSIPLIAIPTSVITGDFTGDGKLDIATGNRQGGNVTLFVNNGSRSFAAGVSFDTGGGPTGMTTGDFNRDGRLDIATANDTLSTVAVLLNNGAGGFESAKLFSVPGTPFSVSARDFNGDGKLDLAVGNRTFNFPIHVFTGAGNGMFAFAGSFPVSTNGVPVAVVGADFDNDGKPDMASANVNTNNVSVFLNTVASPTFTLQTTHFTEAGFFGSNTSPTIEFPVNLDKLHVGLDVTNDTNFPTANDVFFTGPPATGFVSRPAEELTFIDNTEAFYETPSLPNSSSAAGNWTVVYRGTSQSFSLVDPQPTSRFVIPYPTVTVGGGGTLNSLSWTYRNPDGSTTSGVPSFISAVRLFVRTTAMADNQVISLSPELPAATTSHTLTTTVNWSDVAELTIVYRDDLGNLYGATFGGPTRFTFNIMEFAHAGSFALGSLSPAVTFPEQLDSYRARFEAFNDSNFPPASNVLFSGPGGSGLGPNTPADQQFSFVGPTNANYQSPSIFPPAAAPGGTYTVRYKDIDRNFNVADPQAATRLVIPVPTLTVTNDILQSVAWVYKDPTTGATIPAPAFMRDIQVQLDGQFGQLYDSEWLPPSTTSHVLSQAINWSSVIRMFMAYNDDFGNHYVVSFQTANVGATAVVEGRAERVVSATGTTSDLITNVFVDALPGTVQSVTVTGGPFSNTPVPNTGTGTDPQGNTFDVFNIRQIVGTFPPQGTLFTFTVTPVSGPQQTIVKTFSNTPTNQFFSITNLTGFTLEDGKLGEPLDVRWDLLPITFPITEVHLTAVGHNASSSFCHGVQPEPVPFATSGTVTLPTTCAGQPVVKTNVCVFVTGPNGEKTSSCHFHEGAGATLTIVKAGTGNGTVTSSRPGINCGNDCFSFFNSTPDVGISGTPDGTSTFAGLTGDPDCTDGLLTMNANKTCTATFNQHAGVLTSVGVAAPCQCC